MKAGTLFVWEGPDIQRLCLVRGILFKKFLILAETIKPHRFGRFNLLQVGVGQTWPFRYLKNQAFRHWGVCATIFMPHDFQIKKAMRWARGHKEQIPGGPPNGHGPTKIYSIPRCDLPLYMDWDLGKDFEDVLKKRI